ncbi:MAG TPA: VCBS repeat-containing protein, partial [Candidatus Marinimicrobia bacterium]|nr:VCBS repeat-containing protein [Candidatus Neomarinimicrobiota bacterium]
MRKIVNGLFIITCTVSLVFAGDFVQTGVAPPYIDGADTLFGGVPGSASRGALVGTDLDQDGLREVWVTSYSNGGQVFCFEEAGTDTLAFVWASAEITADYSTPRDVHTGDLDSDGKGEIIFHVGRWTGESNPDAGLHVYEWDGINDNGYGTEAAFRVDFMNALNDSLAESRVEGFSVGDIDGDGQDEILLANNGTSDPVWGTQDGSTPYSNDRFIIMSVSGDIGGFGATIVEEYSMSPRDVDKDGVRENALGGGSPQDIIICDTDGDGNLEAACFSWNNLAVFFIEATGPDAYTIGDTTYRKLGISDDWTLGASAADNDGDGKDEVYVTGYYDGSLFVITDSDDDATSLDQTGGPGDWTGNSEIAIIHEFGGGGGFGTSTGAGPTNSGMGGVIHGGTAGVSDINVFELAAGGNPLDSSSWTHSSYALDDATSGWGFKAKVMAEVEGGVLLPYQAVNDTLENGELDPAGNRVFRLAEWDESVTVRDIT